MAFNLTRHTGRCIGSRCRHVSTSTPSLLSANVQAGFDYVPQHGLTSERDVVALQKFFDASKRLMVVTGAGISTESGIPDYRSEGVGLYDRAKHKPVQFQDFMKSDLIRRRYWARNFVGWPRFSSLKPNPAHLTLAEWERAGRVHWLVTQNVDRLHSKAGSTKVSELHGSGHAVRCRARNCDYRVSRADFQETLAEANPTVAVRLREWEDQIRPDGDVAIESELVKKFVVPKCPKCSDGILQTDIVFFGDNIPRETVDVVDSRLTSADSLLIIGSSLMVMSSYRLFLIAVQDLKIPVAILNIGPTRADDSPKVVYMRCRAGDLLPKIQM